MLVALNAEPVTDSGCWLMCCELAFRGRWAGVKGPGLFWGRRGPCWMAEAGMWGAIPCRG